MIEEKFTKENDLLKRTLQQTLAHKDGLQAELDNALLKVKQLESMDDKPVEEALCLKCGDSLEDSMVISKGHDDTSDKMAEEILSLEQKLKEMLAANEKLTTEAQENSDLVLQMDNERQQLMQVNDDAKSQLGKYSEMIS